MKCSRIEAGKNSLSEKHQTCACSIDITCEFVEFVWSNFRVRPNLLKCFKMKGKTDPIQLLRAHKIILPTVFGSSLNLIGLWSVIVATVFMTEINSPIDMSYILFGSQHQEYSHVPTPIFHFL